AGFTRSSAARCRTEGSAAPGRSSPAAIATRRRFAIWAYSGVGLRGSGLSNTVSLCVLLVEYSDTSRRRCQLGGSHADGPHSASSLFSKTLQVVSGVGAVAAEPYEGSDFVELYDGLLPDLPELRALILVGATDRWLDDRVYRYADLVSKRPATPGAIAPGDPATQPLAILYTSGTMGKPKGVVLSHANISLTARASGQALGHTGEDRVLGAVPVFTIFGMHV